MTASEFGFEINKLNAGCICVTMEQCHSGGFISTLQGKNRIIASACRAEESSWALDSFLYDEFSYYWTSAVNGKDTDGNEVDADENDDGLCSFYEAFEYAIEHDSKNETPQYFSSKPHLGEYYTLKGPEAAFDSCVHNEYFDQDTYIYGYNVYLDSVILSNSSLLQVEPIKTMTINNIVIPTGCSFVTK